MRISTERFGVKVMCRFDGDIDDVKNTLYASSDKYNDLYIPHDITKEGNGYSFYVNHRQSLKDYVSKNGFSIDEFYGLLRRINKIYETCREDFHNIVFDYECVFWGVSAEDVEFVYAPEEYDGKDVMARDNRCSDMLCIVSLMIEFEDDTYKEMIKDILKRISDWEDRQLRVLPGEEREPFGTILEYANTKIRSANGGLADIGNQMIDKVKNLIYSLLGFLSEGKGAVTTEGETARQVKKIRVNGVDYFNNIDYKGKTDVLYIGRDPTWADIILSAIFVSRKHAMIFCEKGKWFIKDLNSLNGTFVDDKKIDEGETVRLHHNSIIHFGRKEGTLKIGLR